MARLCSVYHCTRQAAYKRRRCVVHFANPALCRRDERRKQRVYDPAFRALEAKWAREYRARKKAGAK